MNKNILKITFASILCCCLFRSTAQTKVESFKLSDVQLLSSPFEDACETDLNYILSLNPDRLLAPYLKEAGLTPKAPYYGNWESMGLAGHIGGHYLSALSNIYATTGNKEVFRRINYMVDELGKCQQANGNGYVGGIPEGKKLWDEIAAGKIDAGGFSLNGKWVPWYNLHKLFAGLIDAYQRAGVEKAKTVLVKLTDWCLNLTNQLNDQQMQTMLQCEQGGMNEALANVAAITGNKAYLTMAERFSHKAILNPLLQQKDELTGLHANTQIPKVIGFMRIGEISGNADWENAASFFWETVVNNRTISIGGNSVREHFNPIDDFSTMMESREGPETCNSYNMLKLTEHLFLQHPMAKYMDYYERTVYNHILSTQNPNGGFVYFTPARPRHYKVYSQPQEDFWCCVGSGLENHGKYGEMIYAHDGDNLLVNLFIPSILKWTDKGVELTQTTQFPYEEKTVFQLKLKKNKRFAISIRKPSWINGNELEISVNGKVQKLKADGNSYVSKERIWKSGDKIEVNLPMHTTIEKLPDNSDWISFIHGPIVLAAATDTTDLVGMFADDSRSGHIANGPLYPIGEAPVFVSDGTNLQSAITPVSNHPMEFTIAGNVYPAKYQSLHLEPFYKVQNTRYMLYWPFTTQAGLEKRKEEERVSDSLKQAIDRMTVDRVLPGEQQPEADHNFKEHLSEAGIHEGRHWRHTKDWFSYDLNNSTQDAQFIRITYWGADVGRQFEIFVNDQLLSNVSLEGKGGDQFVNIDYPLPKNLLAQQPKTITIKFQAGEHSIAGGIFEVRLMR